MGNVSFTIGIPAKNEEKNIRHTLLSILKNIYFIEQKLYCNYEIIVYVNNSIDATNLIAEKTLKSSNIKDYKVFKSDIIGKANAVNYITQNSKYDNLFFCDADITLEVDTLYNLLSALNGDRFEQYKVFSSIGLSKSKFYLNPVKAKLAIKMKEYATRNGNIVDGALYLIRKKYMPVMRTNIINDDLFISLSCGYHQIKRVKNAVIHQEPVGSLKEYKKRKYRIELGDKQLKKLFKEKYDSFRKSSKDKRSKKERKRSLRLLLRIYETFLFPIDIIMKIINKKIKKQIQEVDTYKAGW